MRFAFRAVKKVALSVHNSVCVREPRFPMDSAVCVPRLGTESDFSKERE